MCRRGRGDPVCPHRQWINGTDIPGRQSCDVYMGGMASYMKELGYVVNSGYAGFQIGT